MTKKANKEKEKVPLPANDTSFAVIIELEHIITHTRKAAFDVLLSILKEKKYALSPIDFSRFCLTSSPENYLEDLLSHLGTKKISVSKLAEDVHSGVAMYLSSNKLKICPGLKKLQNIVKENNLLQGILTALPEDLYKMLLQKAGIEDTQTRNFSFTDFDKNFPSADIWLKVAKDIEIPPRNCTALVSSSFSCKAALTAGMRCVAIPDEFTAFQDFGGCHMLVDSMDDIDMKELFSFASEN